METVRRLARGDGPPTFALAPRPGELPVAVWRLDHGASARGRHMAHTHDFPMLVYSADAQGTVPEAGATGRSPQATCSSSRPARFSDPSAPRIR